MRYIGSFKEISNVLVLGDPTVVPVDPEHDLIAIYDVVGDEEEEKLVRLVGVEGIDRSSVMMYRSVYVHGDRIVKFLRYPFEEEVVIEDLKRESLMRVEGEPIIVPMHTDRLYRFVVLEVVPC